MEFLILPPQFSQVHLASDSSVHVEFLLHILVWAILRTGINQRPVETRAAKASATTTAWSSLPRGQGDRFMRSGRGDDFGRSFVGVFGLSIQRSRRQEANDEAENHRKFDNEEYQMVGERKTHGDTSRERPREDEG